ncbi:MAG: T9SS type A sorting domain-containing protein [Leptolyngbya sp. SIO3F4]|nr:T9SS type A sorting domain-containing protein [Leptolyngbya sp. SIO3F4]
MGGNNTGAGLLVTWGPPVNNQGTVLNGLCPGTYTATVTDGLGCDTVISVEVGNVVANSLAERNASEGWRIYPNPASDIVRLEWQGEALEEINIRAYSASGQEVQGITASQGASGNVRELNVSDWPQGLYWIIVEHKGMKDIQRVIVQR